MSVPLDRLYDFLHDICNRDDLLIYGFYPHGSRKLEDIRILKEKHRSWFSYMTTPALIFHDQEHLLYKLYHEKDLQDYIETHIEKFPHSENSKNFKNLVAGMHLRACVLMPVGVYDQVLLCHSEKNSEDLELYQQNGFIGVYYWSHALISRDWFRFAKLDPMLIPDFNNIVHDFLIYNRSWSGTREYRLTLVELLVNQDLVSCCKTSFSEFDNQINYSQFEFRNPSLAICRYDLHELFAANDHDATASADYNSKDYSITAIEIVLETLFDDSRHHLTEKILRPIACGRPFILASTPGSLHYLRQYGFQTFDGLIDESYDLIPDPVLRLKAITQEMKRIRNLECEEKKLLWSRLYKISEQNKMLFFSDKWQDNIIKEFQYNFESAVSKLTATGKYQKELDRLALIDPIIAYNRSNDIPSHNGPTLECRNKLVQWLQEKNSLT